MSALLHTRATSDKCTLSARFKINNLTANTHITTSFFIKIVALLRFNSAPLGAVITGGGRDVFPRTRKDFKDKSLIAAALRY